MNRIPQDPIRKTGLLLTLLLLGSVVGMAQSADGGWRRLGDGPQAPAVEPAEPVTAEAQPQGLPAPPTYGVPPELVVKAGTNISVRINEQLSSNRNHPGDTFSAVLMQPVVVDGVVIAARGQSVFGRVVEAVKATSDTPSRLAIALTEISLVDGEQVPIDTQLSGFTGGQTPAGEQAGTVLNTTVAGAVIGSAIGWGKGAAIGAGAGAMAGAVAVLLTRNRPTVIYPESALTFRVEAPFTVSTSRSPQAFRFADPNDYSRPAQSEVKPRPPAGSRCYGCGPVNSPYPYWGPSVGIGVVIGRGGYFGRRR